MPRHPDSEPDEIFLAPLGTEGVVNGSAAANKAKTCCPRCGGAYSTKKSGYNDKRTARYCKPCSTRHKDGAWRKNVSKPLFGL